jgi:hypothetical protein
MTFEQQEKTLKNNNWIVLPSEKYYTQFKLKKHTDNT